MIERMLEADRLLALGLTDQAERIYWQAVELDPQSAIAVVGLARVASERGDDRTALEFARKALLIDPESPAAIRMTARLEEIIVARGEVVPETTAAGQSAGQSAGQVAGQAAPTPVSGPQRHGHTPATAAATKKSGGFLDRLLRGR